MHFEQGVYPTVYSIPTFVAIFYAFAVTMFDPQFDREM